jgi:hypothetical protein
LKGTVAERSAIAPEPSNRGRFLSGLREVHVRKLFTRVAVAAALLLPVAKAVAQGTGNASSVAVPALDGFGLATLAGGLAMAGAWAVARARRKQ